ncbi:hypothetical protein HID58_057161, partial [Brassica napus]
SSTSSIVADVRNMEQALIPRVRCFLCPHGSAPPSSGQPHCEKLMKCGTCRVDNVYGDRKLVCTLLPDEEQVAAAVSA